MKALPFPPVKYSYPLAVIPLIEELSPVIFMKNILAEAPRVVEKVTKPLPAPIILILSILSCNSLSS